MTKKQKHPTLLERIALLENIVAGLEQRIDGLAARIEWQQIQNAEIRKQQRDDPQPRKYIAGRWHQRDGNVYGRYTYEAGQTPYEAWVRRSPPATE